jgi:polar amino acid transport system substrate-binding protein
MRKREALFGPRRRHRSLTLASMVLVLAGCSSTPISSNAPATVRAPTSDKLAQIQSRGTLVGYTDPNYAPQSMMVKGGTRRADTKCAANQLTSAEVTGFDVETTELVAQGLGVEACFVVPTWTVVTGGHWGDRFDIAYGSGAINADRMLRLYMTQPYYSTPQIFFVRKDSPYQKPSDLSGKTIGTCTSCTVEYYLKGTLVIPGVEIKQKVDHPKLVGFETEVPGLEALDAGKLDAFLTAQPVGLEAIKEGRRLRPLDEAAFTMYPTGLVDKSSALDETAFIDRVNQIVRSLHADGSLKKLSIKWFGTDYATAAGEFNLDSIGQQVP